jgi:hypothetical protein
MSHYTIHEAARRWKVEPDLVHHHAATRRIPHDRGSDGRVRIRAEVVDGYKLSEAGLHGDGGRLVTGQEAAAALKDGDDLARLYEQTFGWTGEHHGGRPLSDAEEALYRETEGSSGPRRGIPSHPYRKSFGQPAQQRQFEVSAGGSVYRTMPDHTDQPTTVSRDGSIYRDRSW